MLDNNKCILVYGLSNVELLNLKELGYKIIEITPEMCEMTLMDVLLGMRLEIFNSNPIKEKVILYNNLSQDELRKAITDTRQNIKDGILAVVTQQSINWQISYLIKHLRDEKEWYSKVRKEKSNE
ncbi:MULTISPECIES: DUF3783 domain-containing protein [unclassified Clostridium]|uniref:DUF3783 domain-containing protein n=1 Tax=unclassified Clostridium TaxID=2614128 RepID=UPI00189AEFF4|nr:MULTISPECIES: DUF3783 domain-containing protein [unclassified Clostridium]MBP3914959.1 DUF3783 domain-containing protein [Clostridium sp.]MEE0934020.1 DUF3783 domain-containing protein [Clostridium sp.]